MANYTYNDIEQNTEYLIMSNLATTEDIEKLESSIESMKVQVSSVYRTLKVILFLLFLLLITVDVSLIVGGITI